MADVKQIYSRKDDTTYDIKDAVAREQLATKQDAISNVSVNYQEDGGSPDASAQFENGTLAFSMKNMKMKFSELTADEKASLKGEDGAQGATGVYDATTQDFLTTLETTTGQSQTTVMTQKAVTDEFDYRNSVVWSIAYPSTTNRFIHPDGTWHVGGSPNNCCIIPIKAGLRYRVIPRDGGTCHVQFLVSNNSKTSGTVADIAGDTLPLLTEETVLQAPSTANYLYVRRNDGGSDTRPEKIEVMSDMRELLWKEMELNLDETYAGYYNCGNIGTTPKRSASEFTLTYTNLVQVRKGCAYKVKIESSLEPAAINYYACVGVVDEDGISRQAFSLVFKDGNADEISFVSITDGNLIVSVDVNYTSLSVEELSFGGSSGSSGSGDIETRVANLETISERRLAVSDDVAYNSGGGIKTLVGWCVCDTYIPCEEGSSIVYKYGKQYSQAYLVEYDENKEHIGYFGANDSKGYRNLTAKEGTAYIRISFAREVNGVTNTNPVSINGVDYIVDEFSRYTKLEEAVFETDTEHGVIGRNYPDEVKDVLICETNLFKNLQFLHISDNHNSNYGYADDFLNYCSAKFLVNTGDLVQDKFTDSKATTISCAISPSKPVYLVLGNHDYSKAPSQQDVFDAFYGDANVDGTVNYHNNATGGIVTNKTYYSIDDANSSTKCIFLNINDGWADEGMSSLALANFSNGKMSQEQIEWFISELQAAKTNSLHVCVFVHLLGDVIDTNNCVVTFTDYGKGETHDLTFLHQIVDGFINGGTVEFTYDNHSYSATFAAGGAFVAWFFGHSHRDMVGWLKNYPKQLGVGVLRPYYIGNSGSYDGDKLGVHFNFVNVNPTCRSLSIYRVGQQKTVYGVDRKNFRIFY